MIYVSLCVRFDIFSLGSCLELRKLRLTWCDRITDVSALGACPALEELDLANCKEIAIIAGLSGYLI